MWRAIYSVECGEWSVELWGGFRFAQREVCGEVGSLRIHVYADVEVRTVPA